MRKMLKAKKGAFDQMSGLAMGVLGFVVTIAVAFLVLAKIGANTDVAANGNATAAVTQLTTDTYSIVGWVSLVILIIIAVLVLGYVKLMRQ